MTNFWIPNPGTGVSPVREGEILTAYMLRSGSVNRRPNEATSYDWSDCNNNCSIAHFQVSPPRTAAPTAEPVTMSADEVLIRAREAVIIGSNCGSDDAVRWRNTERDDFVLIQVILAYERDRAKPLAEVAPHTAEDPDERSAYNLYLNECSAQFFSWAEREKSERYCDFLKAIKRGRELERGA